MVRTPPAVIVSARKALTLCYAILAVCYIGVATGALWCGSSLALWPATLGVPEAVLRGAGRQRRACAPAGACLWPAAVRTLLNRTLPPRSPPQPGLACWAPR